MPSIADTIARFQRGLGAVPDNGAAGGRLVPLEGFGRDPGNLDAFLHVPTGLPTGAPLVVVLHGCTQTAAAYDHGSGWSQLADRFGFAVLYPAQKRANNPNLCFNWFAPEDTQRGDGEVESIREMIVAAVAQHGLDRMRVFVTGLSAGGAMTAAMLATYPELFAGGAIIAGLPYGTATGVSAALERMRGRGHDSATLGRSVRAATAHRGPWPIVSVWHGSADATVHPINAAIIVEQWCDVHGVAATAAVTDRIDGQRRRTWHDAGGRRVVEEYRIEGLGHGTPVAISGDEAYGAPGPHMLRAGISSTYRIAASWGIVPGKAPARQDGPAMTGELPASPRRPTAFGGVDPARVIDDALRAAGLIKP